MTISTAWSPPRAAAKTPVRGSPLDWRDAGRSSRGAEAEPGLPGSDTTAWSRSVKHERTMRKHRVLVLDVFSYKRPDPPPCPHVRPTSRDYRRRRLDPLPTAAQTCRVV